MDRRFVLKNLTALAGASALPAHSQTNDGSTSNLVTRRLRKIATEEAFTIPEIAQAFRAVIKKGGPNLDLLLLKQFYDAAEVASGQSQAGSNQTANRDSAAKLVLPKLLDFDKIRLDDMNANGVDMHVLSLVMPGVQMFESQQAIELAALANDRLSSAILRNPSRYAGLACLAPQAPKAAVKEMERAVSKLKLNGFIINSHTENAYLDDPRFLPILEAAEALDRPLYIHPRAPSDGMAQPFSDYRLEGAVWGYGVETATHILRLIFGGIFDRFPKLQVVIGHMGEALPFWLGRLDFMGAPGARAGRKNRLMPSDYFQRNITITTSGVEDPLALKYCIDKLGANRIMWAIDYPFQPTQPSVAFIESAPISEADRASIAYGNAEKIFGIKGVMRF
jgi:5-carboxyvanillate decarboxylase